jgi:hypothetical protein
MMAASWGMPSGVAGSTGQALVEFAMTIAVFMLLILGAVTASVYTVERGAAVTGVAAGARVAVGGTGGPTGENAPNLAGAGPAVERVARPLLFGTKIDQLPPGQPCPANVSSVPRGRVEVCATRSGNLVTVRLVGWPAGLGPAAWGLEWSLDVSAQVHTVTFSR